MSLNKSGNSLVVSVFASAWHQPSGIYGEVCIYKTDPRSVSGASCCPMGGVTTEGTGMGGMVGGGLIAIAFDIEDDADRHPSFFDKLVILPRDDGRPVRAVQRGVASVCVMSERAAF